MDKGLSIGGTWVLLATIVSMLSCLAWAAGTSPAQSRVTINPPDTQAVVQAIQDEVYDEGCQGWVGDVADGHDGDTMRMHVYIQPELRTGALAGDVGKGEGWAIYKLRPIGEVYRLFWFRTDGLAVLGGHPEWDFPPTEPSYLTIFMDDDQLCKLKHDWLRINFDVESKPSQQRLRDAAARQKIRLGSRYRPHKRDCSFDWRSH